MNHPHPPQYGAAAQQPAIKPFFDDNIGMRLLVPIKVSGLAIAAGYLNLFAAILVPAPLALIVGVAAVAELKRNPEKRRMERAIFAW